MTHTEWIDLLDRRKKLEYLVEQIAEGQRKERCQKELMKMNGQVIAEISSKRAERKAPKFLEVNWNEYETEKNYIQ